MRNPSVIKRQNDPFQPSFVILPSHQVSNECLVVEIREKGDFERFSTTWSSKGWRYQRAPATFFFCRNQADDDDSDRSAWRTGFRRNSCTCAIGDWHEGKRKMCVGGSEKQQGVYEFLSFLPYFLPPLLIGNFDFYRKGVRKRFFSKRATCCMKRIQSGLKVIVQDYFYDFWVIMLFILPTF